jgi:hypothetical protein
MEIAPGLFEPSRIFGEIARQVDSYGTLTWDTLGSQGAPTAEA